MAAWITIYAREPTALSPADVLAALQAADLYDLSAELDPYWQFVGKVAEALRMDAGAGLDGACLHYWEPELQPMIRFHRWVEPERVAEELSRVRDNARLDPEVEAGLVGVVEVIALELGEPMSGELGAVLEGFGAVLGWEAARVLAHATHGFVKDPEDGWWRVDGQGNSSNSGEHDISPCERTDSRLCRARRSRNPRRRQGADDVRRRASRGRVPTQPSLPAVTS
ncbi:hypothetical protein [Nannocystis pusilla]|uniref:hypothetical protein n=1 Tax=Nannocystis pusilla TaxID=889268 RepID=UPI003B7AFFBC